MTTALEADAGNQYGRFDITVPSLDNIQLEAVPEPTALVLVGLGTAGWMCIRRKRPN